MKPSFLKAALLTTLVLGWLTAGCATSDAPATSHAGHSHDAQKETASAAPKTGLACSLCTCRKFEPRVEDANVCRMCWHPLAAHTR